MKRRSERERERGRWGLKWEEVEGVIMVVVVVVVEELKLVLRLISAVVVVVVVEVKLRLWRSSVRSSVVVVSSMVLGNKEKRTQKCVRC